MKAYGFLMPKSTFSANQRNMQSSNVINKFQNSHYESQLQKTASHKFIKYKTKLNEFLSVRENNRNSILMIIYTFINLEIIIPEDKCHYKFFISYTKIVTVGGV